MVNFLDPQVLGRIKDYELRSLRLVESYLAGMHASRLLGISTEFAQHRQYVPGDDPKHLDWKVFAKTDRYFIKQYEAETNMQVCFLLDASASMFFQGNPAGLSKFEYAGTALAGLGYLLSQQKDAFGLVLFDQKVRTYLPPKGSLAHFRQMVAVLDQATPGPETDLAEVLFAILPRLKRRSLIVIFSDFLTAPERLTLALGQINFGQNDLLLFRVEDPLEREFPFAGPTIFLGPEQEGRLLCDPRDLRHAYLAARRRHRDGLHDACVQFGFSLEDLPTDARLDDVLSKFLAFRQARRKRR
jgi:uncharacterized protein (DUF58 family)